MHATDYQFLRYKGKLAAADSLRIEEQEKGLWMAFILWVDNTPSDNALEKFRSDRGKSCEYDFLIGTPPYQKSSRRHLLRFRDEDVFIPQLLNASFYSVYIPPGCSPSIVTSSAFWKKSSV
ncbi:unnamed protein product, partial [Mesorhabditis belari]|uniref:Uncharacterized protein n=1 Tax=Mesorhabditis belari TaxID=2138241 RepID=A0AAF3EV50_9BILA